MQTKKCTNIQHNIQILLYVHEFGDELPTIVSHFESFELLLTGMDTNIDYLQHFILHIKRNSNYETILSHLNLNNASGNHFKNNYLYHSDAYVKQTIGLSASNDSTYGILMDTWYINGQKKIYLINIHNCMV
eukprot:445264_1